MYLCGLIFSNELINLMQQDRLPFWFALLCFRASCKPSTPKTPVELSNSVGKTSENERDMSIETRFNPPISFVRKAVDSRIL
ncbi:MAG: hypothetical protein RI894_1620 [Bacteroidota bacterium]|jgi:hypothetical protein